ncbi:MAG: PilN domain-containing protein [Planctomycetota bacterium]
MGRGVNLIPASLLQQRAERRRARLGLRVTAAYLLTLSVGALGYLGLHMPTGADAAAGESAVSAEQVSLLNQNITATQADLAEAQRRLQGSRVLSERPDWSALLRLVAVAAGEDVVLGNFSLTTTGPTIDAGATIRLGGIARDPWTVSSFVLRLEASELFDRVTIESSGREPYRQQTATAFTLRCELFGGEAAPPPEAR